MGKHRSRLRILANILSVVNSGNGVKKTQIMYQAYLSYNLLVQYLNDVTNAGLLVCGTQNCYHITPKGKRFLAKFKKFVKFQEKVKNQLSLLDDQRMLLEKMCQNSDNVVVGCADLQQSV